jgi:hypothetical protein
MLALAMVPVIVFWARRSRGGQDIRVALAEHRQAGASGVPDAVAVTR